MVAQIGVNTVEDGECDFDIVGVGEWRSECRLAPCMGDHLVPEFLQRYILIGDALIISDDNRQTCAPY
jgi:hypothetical protein